MSVTRIDQFEFSNYTNFPQKMKNYLNVVGTVTGILIVFVTLIRIYIAYILIWGIFLAGPILIVWMVWAVLQAPIEIKESFGECWYQDRPKVE